MKECIRCHRLTQDVFYYFEGVPSEMCCACGLGILKQKKELEKVIEG